MTLSRTRSLSHDSACSSGGSGGGGGTTSSISSDDGYGDDYNYHNGKEIDDNSPHSPTATTKASSSSSSPARHSHRTTMTSNTNRTSRHNNSRRATKSRKINKMRGKEKINSGSSSSSCIRIMIVIFMIGIIICLMMTTILLYYIGSNNSKFLESSMTDASSSPFMVQNKVSPSLMMLRALQRAMIRHQPYHNISSNVTTTIATTTKNNVITNDATTTDNNIQHDSAPTSSSSKSATTLHDLQNMLIGFNEMDGGKEQIYQLVKDALGIKSFEEINDDYERMIEQLPNVSQIIQLYGAKPVVYGLETCREFQNTGDPSQHFLATAGTFNTGTNMMSELLIANCYMPARYAKYHTAGVRWQVIWGKHTPITNETYRQIHKTGLFMENTTSHIIPPQHHDELLADNVFPAVMIRDPYQWMRSMCRHDYAARWYRDGKNPLHCPNLIQMNHRNNVTESVPVRIYYKDFIQHHHSLVYFWNDWYRDYVHAKFPRLMIRYEDMIFHPKTITKLVCTCAGGQMKYPDDQFIYITDSAKKGKAHGNDKTGYLEALVKYGTDIHRYDGYNLDDLSYTKQHLNSDIMQLFQYQYHRRDDVTTTA